MSRLASVHGHLVSAISPSSAATADFNLLSPYRHFRLVGWMMPATDNVDVYIRFSNDGGATFRAGASDYNWSLQRNVLSGTPSDLHDADTADNQGKLMLAVGNVAGEFFTLDLTIIAARTASIRTSWTGHGHAVSLTPTPVAWRATGSVIVASEINNAVRLLFASGNIASGELSLFGMP